MYSPQPFGLSVQGGGELTAQDRVYVDAVVRRFLNFKQVSNLENLRRYYDLPNGGHFIVQYMGGIFRVIIYKQPTESEEDSDGTAKLIVPMLFCGGVSSDAVSSDKDLLSLKISSLTQNRLVLYSEDAELPEQNIALNRFNVGVNTTVVPEFNRASTQYQLQRPTWYSGAMAEVMQIVGGYGKQPIHKKDNSDDEKDKNKLETIQFTLPELVIKEVEKQLKGVRLPGYTGLPSEDGQFQYDYKFSKTHAVGFDTENFPWLLQVSSKGLYAMPLPVVAATITDQFRTYVTKKNDTELLAILDRFGALPSGESFPTDEQEFEAWYRAGVIIKLCDMDAFYENLAYSDSCGWSFNTTGSIGFNTCFNTENGYKVGFAYRLDINLQAALEYTRGWISKIAVPSENVNDVATYLSKLMPLLDSDAKSLAIKYKLRRSLETVIERSSGGGSVDSSEVDYWDTLELEAIAQHSADLVRVDKGFLYYSSSYQSADSLSAALVEEYDTTNYKKLLAYLKTNAASLNKILSAPFIRFPKPDSDNAFDEFSFTSDKKEKKNCDTIIFGYFVGDALKVIKYFIDWADYKKTIQSNFKDSMDIGTFKREIIYTPSSSPGYFYTSDLDLRDNDYRYQITGTYEGTYKGSVGPTYMSGYIYKFELYTAKTTYKVEVPSCLNIGVTIPYFNRNNCLVATETYTPYELSCDQQDDTESQHRYCYMVTETPQGWGYNIVLPTNYALVVAEVDSAVNDPNIIGSVSDKPVWEAVGELFDKRTIVSRPPYGTLVFNYGTAQPQIRSTAKLYGTPLSDTILIADTISRTTYFSSSTYLDGCKVVFGTQQYANIGLSMDSNDRQSWGSTSFSDDKSAQHFIGVINE